MRNTKLITLGLLLSTVFISCGSSIESARESITGTWEIDEILLYNQTENKQELSTKGVFTFNPDKNASYSFYRNNEIQENLGLWTLIETEENCGFTKCKKFNLSIGTEEFVCEFGDQTSDAHCGATEIRLLQEGLQLSPFTNMIIYLRKS